MPRRSNPAVRDALLDAARTEFGRAGLERARVEDIARRAGISKGAFYLHFASKEDAFREILQRFLGALEEQASRRREAELRFESELARPSTSDLVEQRIELECLLDTELLEVLWRNRLIVAALDRAPARPHLDTVADFRRRMRALVANRIALKQREGWLRPDLDPLAVGDVIVGAYEAFGRRLVEMRHKPDLAAWARGFLKILYQGVFDASAARPSRPAAPARA